jgi:hypothetical protein
MAATSVAMSLRSLMLTPLYTVELGSVVPVDSGGRPIGSHRGGTIDAAGDGCRTVGKAALPQGREHFKDVVAKLATGSVIVTGKVRC